MDQATSLATAFYYMCAYKYQVIANQARKKGDLETAGKYEEKASNMGSAEFDKITVEDRRKLK